MFKHIDLGKGEKWVLFFIFAFQSSSFSATVIMQIHPSFVHIQQCNLLLAYVFNEMNASVHKKVAERKLQKPNNPFWK